MDYHILFKITPDAPDRTKKSNATKFQIFQLAIRELSRMHCLNLFQFGGDVSEGHVDCDLNAQHISSVIETNFKAPVESKISVGYLNRENFESQFKNRPLHDFPLKFATWGAFLGADLLALFKVAGLGGPRAKMPCPLTPITWDRLGDVFWFPVEDKNKECKITQVYLHLFETVLGPGGASRLEARYANRSNLLHNRCEFYSDSDFVTFNEQILRWRDEFIENINKTKKPSTLGKRFPKKRRKIATSLW